MSVNESYKQQVRLLLDVLPEVAKESCFALDRQHPRDIFDIKLLLGNEGLTEAIRHGFIYGLLSSDRPIHELLNPNLLDQRGLFERHFLGMTTVPFTYEDFEATRSELIKQVRAVLLSLPMQK